MENASKALIIAGAILLAILIISLGLIVYNQAKETVGSVNLSQQEIEAFNAKFTSFEGTSVSGSKVNQLIQTVIASNQQAVNDSTGHYVGMIIPSMSGKSILMFVDPKNGCIYQEDDFPFEIDVDLAFESCVGTAGSAFNISISSPLKVTPGKKYTVQLVYHNGIVTGIGIEE